MPEEPLTFSDIRNILGITGSPVGTTDSQILTGKKFDDFLKVKPVTTPTTDASYGIFYCDTSDGKPKFKTTGGIVYDLSASSSGEANTASNIGTAGTGVFKQKSGVNFELYKLNSIDTDLTIALDSGNNKIDFDLGANVPKTNVGNVFTAINKFDLNLKLKPITTPSTDASYGSIYPDSADSNILKYKDPSGAVTALNVLPISPYNFFIYKDGSNYKAVNGSNGHVDFTNASFFSVIDSCVSALSTGGIIQLGVGDFPLTSQLVVGTSGIRLKGLGVGVTRILYNMASTTVPGLIVAGSIAANKALTANSAKSARTLTVASTSGLVADDWIYLARNVLISDDDPDTYDAEIHQVESVTSTVITLKNKIYAAYNTADSARVNEITFVNDFGIEDIALVDVRATLTDMDGNADTLFRFCRRLTINNVKFENMVFGSCGIQNCYDTTINNASFWFPRVLVGINYGLYVMSASVNTRVTNSTGIGCRHTITTGPVGGSQATTFGPGRQRGLHVSNSTSSICNTADFDTHEGCVGAMFVNCGAIGGDIAGGLQTRTSGFNTRNPATFIGCWTEGTYGQCAYVFSSNNDAGTEEIPGGDQTVFIGCQFRNTHPATGLDQTGIEIEGNRSNVVIMGCQFHNIPDKAILLKGGNLHIGIHNNQFSNCGTNNTSVEGIIHSAVGDLHDIIVTGNDFGTAGGGVTRPFVVVTSPISDFIFKNNDTTGLTNKDPSIPAGSTNIEIDRQTLILEPADTPDPVPERGNLFLDKDNFNRLTLQGVDDFNKSTGKIVIGRTKGFEESVSVHPHIMGVESYLYDSFQYGNYDINAEGVISPDVKWKCIYNGNNPNNPAELGVVGVRTPSSPTNGFSNVFYLKPYSTPNANNNTNASLVTSTTSYYSDFDVTFYTRTVDQLKTTFVQPWESTWFFWHFNEAGFPNENLAPAETHFYWLILKTNGNIEIGKEDSSDNVAHQRFFTDGLGEPTFTYVENQWYKVRIRMEGQRIRVWLDDLLKADFYDNGTISDGDGVIPAQSSYLASGRFAMYNEDAITEFGPLLIAETDQQSNTELAYHHTGFMEECLHDIANSSSQHFLVNKSGTGSLVTPESVVDDSNAFGVWGLHTGTTTTGRAGIQAGDAFSFSLFKSSETILEWRIQIPDLSTVGDEYKLRIGFMNSLTGDPSEGVWFEYDRLTSVNWCVKGRRAAGTIQAITSSIPVAADTWIKLKIVVSAIDGNIYMFVDGVQAGVIDTNMPIENDFLTVEASIIKSAGTTDRTTLIDYVALDNPLDQSR